MITIAMALNEATETLEKTDLPHARLDAEALLAHVMDKDRSYFRAWPEQVLPEREAQQYLALVARRAQGEPLAYLTGWKEFWSLTLAVNPATLIPRPETELLVEQALAIIPQRAQWRIADLGTGSGAIALALAVERPHSQIFATDIRADTLETARKNAQQLQLENLQFYQGDWFDALPEQTPHRFEIIVSNPPYIDADDPHLHCDGLPHEPRIALTPGINGLAAIHTIIEGARAYLAPPGWLLIEHGYTQGAAVRALFVQAGYIDVETFQDLGNHDRLTVGRIPA